MLDQILAERSRRYFPGARIALVYVGLGDKDGAFEWLRRAVEDRDNWVVFAKMKPEYDPLRSDPRWADLLRRMNLTP